MSHFGSILIVDKEIFLFVLSGVLVDDTLCGLVTGLPLAAVDDSNCDQHQDDQATNAHANDGPGAKCQATISAEGIITSTQCLIANVWTVDLILTHIN